MGFLKNCSWLTILINKNYFVNYGPEPNTAWDFENFQPKQVSQHCKKRNGRKVELQYFTLLLTFRF